MVPPLKLKNLIVDKPDEEVKDVYGLGDDFHKPIETDRSVALATGRSVFERNTFKDFQANICKRDGLDEGMTSNRVALLDDFPEMLKLREE